MYERNRQAGDLLVVGGLGRWDWLRMQCSLCAFKRIASVLEKLIEVGFEIYFGYTVRVVVYGGIPLVFGITLEILLFLIDGFLIIHLSKYMHIKGRNAAPPPAH